MGNLDIIALTLPRLEKPTSMRGRSRKGTRSQVLAPYFLQAMTDKYVRQRVVPAHTMKAYWGRRGIALLLNFGTRRRRVVNFTLRPPHRRERITVPLIRRLRTVLFWAITQRLVVIFYRRFGTTYPAWTRWGTYLGCYCQEGRSSELRLRRGVGQAAHTLSNPQVECTGVLLCVIRE